MNFVRNDRVGEPRETFQIFVYVRMAEGTTSDICRSFIVIDWLSKA